MRLEVTDIFEAVSEKLPKGIKVGLNEIKGAQDLPSVNIERGKERYNLVYDYKKEPRMVHLPMLVAMKKEYGEVLLVARHMTENIRIALRKIGINYIDVAGNAYLNLPSVFVYLDGHKAELKGKDERNRAFTKAGLKLIFTFLERPELLNAPYRTIASEAGVVLNTINKVISGLKGSGFIVTITAKSLKLVNTKALFEKWIQEYELRLKPDLVITRCRFANPNDFYNWKSLKLNSPFTQWGGEPAADLLTNFLNPEILTLYTREDKVAVMKQLKLLPDPQGNVVLRTKFWQQDDSQPTVSETLVYADLLTHGDPRNLEVAKRIYEQYLQSRFS